VYFLYFEMMNGGLYKEPSIISGLVLPSDQKLILGLLATITLDVVPFRAYALFLGCLHS
jgi:hypothetical protein